MEGIKIYAVVKTDRTNGVMKEIAASLYTSERSAQKAALDLSHMEKETEKYYYQVWPYTLKN